MRRFILGLVFTAVALSLGAGTARAGGPADGTGPWLAGDGGTGLTCDSGYHVMFNSASRKAHCFRD